MDFLKDFFLYSPQSPLLFTQLYFWLFFAAVLLCYSPLCNKPRAKTAFLLACSLFFYYKSSGGFVLLLVFTTIANYFFGFAIGRAPKNNLRKWLVALAVALNLSILGYFKYTYFFVDLLNRYVLTTPLEATNLLAAAGNTLFGTTFNIEKIILPVGISFYSFQAISYIVDIYRKQITVYNRPIDFAFYLCFFPQLVAGPIVRANDFIPQIRQRFHLSKSDFNWSFFLILNGLTKKMLLADYLSINFVDRVFAMPSSYTGFENLMASYGYTLQIYCDFSGYTDIAIGVGLLLGYRLPLNFQSPYKATNITDFWRRWHISLSRWLRDYLYISLGGNRKGAFRRHLNLFLTMLLGGLWHGAGVRFLLWGCMHGIALIVHKLWQNLFPSNRRSSHTLPKILGAFITFHFVCFCWIFFRASDMDSVGTIFYQIGNQFHSELIFDILSAYPLVFILLFAGFLIHWLPAKWKERAQRYFTESPLSLKMLFALCVVFLLYQTKTSSIQPFIYFQF